MDDGSRCLLDVINDPNLLESFLENGTPSGGIRTSSETSIPAKVVKKAPVRKTPAKKQTSKKGTQNTTVTSSTSDAKQVDLVTSSGFVNSPPSAMPRDGIPKKDNVPLSGSSPMQIQGTTTVQGQPMIRTSINPGGLNMNSWTVRGQTLSSQMVQGGLPQVLQTIGGQVVLTRPSLQTGMPLQQPQAGQLVQIVQTPNGPAAQLIPVPPQSPVIQPPLGALPKGSKGGNKQILPKPSSASSPAPSGRQSVGPQNSSQSPMVQSNLMPQTISIGPPGNQPQFILGGGPGAPSIISGPNGTLLLNSNFQNYGQNFVLQGNNLVGNMGSLQLTLRAPNPQIVTVSSSNQSSVDTSFMNAINTSVSNPMMRGPQPTFVMNNQGPIFAPRGQNIFSRPPMMSGPPPGTQLLQIQTPNGPMMIALQTNPQVFSSSQGTITVPSGPHFVQSGQNTVQTIFDPRAQIMSNNSGPMIITQNVQQPSPPSPAIQRSGSNSYKSKGVNLADLLKETGILPDSSPPSSPFGTSNQKPAENEERSQDVSQPPSAVVQQQPMFMVPPNQQNILLTPNQTPQLRLALTPDGNVVIQQSLPDTVNLQPQLVSSDPVPTTSKLLDNIKDSCGPGSSQPSPDSTTPTLESNIIGPSTPSSGKVDDGSKKSDRKDGKDSEMLIPITVESLNGGSEMSESKMVVKKSCPDQPVVSGTPVIDSSGAVQISLNNHEFLEKLDSQIKELTNSPSLTAQQKQLLNDFTKLQNTISEARKQSTFHQQQLQQQQQSQTITQVTNTQIPHAVQGQSGVQLVNLLKPSTPTQQIRLIPSPTVTSQAGATYQLANQLITFTTPSNASIPTISAAIGPPTPLVQTQVRCKCVFDQWLTYFYRQVSDTPQTFQVVRVPTPKSPSKTSKATDSQTDRDKLRLKTNKL